MRIDFETTCQLLDNGLAVALPTETVYGLAASLDHEKAIKQIFRLKKRPPHNPLIVHTAATPQIEGLFQERPPGFLSLAHNFWPGPLTMVLAIKTDLIPKIVTAGLNTCAFRVPNHPQTLQVIKNIGPLVMPSANLSGRPSSTAANHIENDFGLDFPVLDGGTCQKGIESTIIIHAQQRWRIIRQGAITGQDLATVLGYVPEITMSTPEKPICPGQLYRHYAPKAKLILDNDANLQDIGVIVGFSDRTYPNGYRLFLLGTSDNPEQVAKNLYSVLRKLDAEKITRAWVDTDFPDMGLWSTIKERLYKAK